MPRTFFLTWIEHRRSRELCRRLNIELTELVSGYHGLRRYIDLVPRTIGFLVQKRPRLVVVQSPSVVLASLVLLLKPWLGYRLILDAHNEAVEPFLHPSTAVLAVTRWLLRRAERVIVTNEQLAQIVHAAVAGQSCFPTHCPPLHQRRPEPSLQSFTSL